MPVTTRSGGDAAAAARARRNTLAVTLLWFAAAAALTVGGGLQAAPGEPPLVLLLAAVLPVATFLVLYSGSAPFRTWVLGLDLRLLVMLQAWRVFGGMFVVLFLHGLLPGLFAWPAGAGDVAVGASAPLVAMVLLRDPGFAGRRGFLAWNLFGILDFVVALGSGVLASGSVLPVGGQATTTLMSVWPLGLVPGFLVPLFTILHLAAILQGRRLGRTGTVAAAAAA